ncbi:oxygen-independent coproporphyrinogen-3 oxidase [Bacillus pakistanensis]|uniref:Heme chaperone HemW n=1 Tax=Rossellomorea pakistanensis TaxID=992288 RepID=A0ABS2NA89_9BACI|nr:radical SAM family heme chaperone HemW [Bacillus pakistanensis]MBM7584740.1 oxygen-independent coproporphyrinogen-3 oxidase [Bacillus pakistanensis]
MVQSAYIHIPFCQHICHYCDFNKVFLKGQPVDEYISALVKEMKLRFQTKVPMKTIFVGGGTPTSLSAKQLDDLCNGIRENIPFENGEFTFEANPGELTYEKLKVLREHGVNRLSFGVQSFNNELLNRIGRTHKSEDVYSSIDSAQKAGFHNISIDLIYSLPGQTLSDFRNTLREALLFNLPHYSAYSLIVEPKTVFYNLMRKGKLNLPSQEAEADMYDLLMNEMTKTGLKQYEISNFAEDGFESKHNLAYWNNVEYYGFGAGAHGYIDGIRYSNYGPLKKYMQPIVDGSLPTIESHRQTKSEMMEEEMFLGLRKVEGVSIQGFQEKFSVDPFEIFNKSITEMCNKNWLEVHNGNIRLTKAGRFLGNEVFQSFIGVI